MWVFFCDFLFTYKNRQCIIPDYECLQLNQAYNSSPRQMKWKCYSSFLYFPGRLSCYIAYTVLYSLYSANLLLPGIHYRLLRTAQNWMWELLFAIFTGRKTKLKHVATPRINRQIHTTGQSSLLLRSRNRCKGKSMKTRHGPEHKTWVFLGWECAKPFNSSW